MSRHWVYGENHVCKWCGQNLLSPHTTSECPATRVVGWVQGEPVAPPKDAGKLRPGHSRVERNPDVERDLSLLTTTFPYEYGLAEKKDILYQAKCEYSFVLPPGRYRGVRLQRRPSLLDNLKYALKVLLLAIWS